MFYGMLLAPSGALYISMRHYRHLIKFHLAYATLEEQPLRIASNTIKSMEVKGAHTIIK